MLQNDSTMGKKSNTRALLVIYGQGHILSFFLGRPLTLSDCLRTSSHLTSSLKCPPPPPLLFSDFTKTSSPITASVHEFQSVPSIPNLGTSFPSCSISTTFRSIYKPSSPFPCLLLIYTHHIPQWDTGASCKVQHTKHKDYLLHSWRTPPLSFQVLPLSGEFVLKDVTLKLL